MPKTLAELRAEKGLNQRQLALQLGLSPAAIALYELGQRTPGLERAKQIAAIFGVAVEDIIFGPACNKQAAARDSA